MDGEYEGYRYFSCPADHGLMLPVKAQAVHIIVECDDASDDDDDVEEADTGQMLDSRGDIAHGHQDGAAHVQAKVVVADSLAELAVEAQPLMEESEL